VFLELDRLGRVVDVLEKLSEMSKTKKDDTYDSSFKRGLSFTQLTPNWANLARKVVARSSSTFTTSLQSRREGRAIESPALFIVLERSNPTKTRERQRMGAAMAKIKL
jgi:hypothetical protein